MRVSAADRNPTKVSMEASFWLSPWYMPGTAGSAHHRPNNRAGSGAAVTFCDAGSPSVDPSGRISAPQVGDLVEAAELVRVAHREHAGDPAVLDDERDRRVELATGVDA